MEIKPVKDAQPPNYPLKKEVSTQQIKASVPQRWVLSRAAKVALGTLAAMSLAGCLPEVYPGEAIAPAVTTENTVSPTEGQPLAGVPAAPAVTVPPLFVHGEGLGAFGCVMVVPPAFLSEDEALSVINNVAKEYGLTFSAKGAPALDHVLQPVTNIYESENKGIPSTYITLTPDFADADHGVAIEFVSVEDVKAWHQETGLEISVERYATQDAAEQLSEALETATPENFEHCTVGVLYDPCEITEERVEGEDWEAAEEKSRVLSVAQLSAQVKDFCEWLKAEGII